MEQELVLESGSRVYWSRTLHGGLQEVMPAIICKKGPRQVQIEVREQEPYSRPARWTPRVKWVDVERLKPRILPAAAFNEPMHLTFHGFELRGWKHPAPTGSSKVFPRGIWYGQIDGYSVGGPEWDEERAVRSAYNALLSSSHRAGLVTSIEGFERWLSDGVDDPYKQQAEQALPDLRRRLKKLDDFIAHQQASRLPKLYAFGCAPEAMKDGYSVFVSTEQGTEAEVMERYAGRDVALVRGASIYDLPGRIEYGVFARGHIDR